MFQTSQKTDNSKNKNTESSRKPSQVNEAEMAKGHLIASMLGAPAQLMEEEEEVQAKIMGTPPVQFMTEEEKEQVQAKLRAYNPMQFQAEEEEEMLQPKPKNKAAQLKEEATNSAVSRGITTSLPKDVNAKMENSFKTSFANINIHKNSDKATQLGALAYTQGQDLYFAPGQYNPTSLKGQELIGHELTHVVQQRAGRVKGVQNKGGVTVNTDKSLENEADVMGKSAAEGKAVEKFSKAYGIQKKEEEESNKYESYKSKTYNLSQDSKLFSISGKDGKVTSESIYTKEKRYSINNEEVIPKGLKVRIAKTDFSYEKSNKRFIRNQVVQVTIIDDKIPDWKNRTVWTTKKNISSEASDGGYYTVIEYNANTRKEAVEVNGEQKSIPKETKVELTDYKVVGSKIFVKAFDKKTKDDYGWINVSNLGKDIYNESFGIEKAEYISEKPGHNTINQDNTKAYKKSGFHFPEIKDGKQTIKIEKGAKVVACAEEAGYVEVKYLDVPGLPIGWTAKTNLKYIKGEDCYEVINSDARLRSKSIKFISTGKKLSAGQFVIEKEKANQAHPEYEYVKVGLAEKNEETYSEKENSDVWIKPDRLTAHWADAKGDHATWKKVGNAAVYTGQIDIINVLGVKSSWKNGKKEYIPDIDALSKGLKEKYDTLVSAASSNGHNIKIISGFRTYPEQKELYDIRNVTGVDTASPGKSNHQNGIAIDINTNGFDTDIYKWMKKNASKYGFIRTVNSEDWHWEYRPSDAKKHGYKMPYITKG